MEYHQFFSEEVSHPLCPWVLDIGDSALVSSFKGVYVPVSSGGRASVYG